MNQYDNYETGRSFEEVIIETKETDHKPSSPKKRRLRKAIGYLLVMSMILGSGFGAGYASANIIATISSEEVQSRNQLSSVQAEITPVILNGQEEANYISPVTGIAQAAGPSIVTVISVKDQIAPGFFSNQLYEAEGTGSGVIYKLTEDGVLIITNNHVIEDAKSVSIILDSGISLEGSVVGFDSKNDLALVKVTTEELNKNNIEKLTPAVAGDSENLLTGELAVAIGNPMGKEFSQTVTAGVISAVDRELNIDDTTLHVIQTDAAINPGNSGGGLFNKNGKLIGINTAKLVDSSVEGMGFAIPVHIALPIIEKIENIGNGENIAYIMDDDRAYLGILMGTTSSNGMSFGVYVQDLVENGPAAMSDLKTGDIILGINGDKVADSTMLFDQLSTMAPQDEITLDVLRNDQFIKINVVLGRYGDYKEE